MTTIRQTAIEVAGVAGYSLEELFGPRRDKHLVIVRHYAMWLAVKRGHGFAATGRVFQRDHTVVMHAYRKLDRPGAADGAYLALRHTARVPSESAPDGQGSFTFVAPAAKRKARAPSPKLIARRREEPRTQQPYGVIEEGVIMALAGLECEDWEIAYLLGRPATQISRRRCRLLPRVRAKRASPPRPHVIRQDYWSAEDKARLEELWLEEALSQRTIARMMQRSLGSVSGKIGRCKLFGRGRVTEGVKRNGTCNVDGRGQGRGRHQDGAARHGGIDQGQDLVGRVQPALLA